MDVTRLNLAFKNNEGYKAIPYLDTEKLWTVGEGWCLERNPFTAQQWKYLLDNGIVQVNLYQAGAEWLNSLKWQDDLKSWQVWQFWPRLNDAQQNVLLEMSFQLGYHAVTSWSQFMAALGRGDVKGAAAAGRDTKWWRTDSPSRAEREMKQLETGLFQTG